MTFPKRIEALSLAQLLQLRTDLRLELQKVEILVRARQEAAPGPKVETMDGQ